MKDTRESRRYVERELYRRSQEQNTAGLIWKGFLMISGLGIFIWGIAGESWIRMIGGFLFILLGLLISNN